MPTCPDMIAELRDERDRIDQAIENLTTSRRILDTVIASAPPTSEVASMA